VQHQQFQKSVKPVSTTQYSVDQRACSITSDDSCVHDAHAYVRAQHIQHTNTHLMDAHIHKHTHTHLHTHSHTHARLRRDNRSPGTLDASCPSCGAGRTRLHAQVKPHTLKSAFGATPLCCAHGDTPSSEPHILDLLMNYPWTTGTMTDELQI
jgi:hypothetical protein